jgi:hypothetical protein
MVKLLLRFFVLRNLGNKWNRMPNAKLHFFYCKIDHKFYTLNGLYDVIYSALLHFFIVILITNFVK